MRLLTERRLSEAQVRSLEKYHVDQAARIRQGTKAIDELRRQVRAASAEHELVLSTCEVLHEDVSQLRDSLKRQGSTSVEELHLAADRVPSMASLRERAARLDAERSAAERNASLHVATTPTTGLAMSSACNPLHDLSAVANYAHRSDASPRAAQPAAASE